MPDTYTLVIKSKDRVSGDANDYVINVGNFFNNITQYEKFVGTLKEAIIHKAAGVGQGYLEVQVDWSLPFQYETNNSGLPSVGMVGQTQANTASLYTSGRNFIFMRPHGSHMRIKMVRYDTEDDAAGLSDHCLVFEITPLE